MTQPQVFLAVPRHLRWLKLAMAGLDVVAVLGVASMLVAAAGHAQFVLALAASMFMWHNAENVVWPRRFEIAGAPLYPAGQVWPHVTFTATLWAGAAERLLVGTAALGSRASIAWQLVGLALFWSGAGLRLWAFTTRGRDYLADPRRVPPPEPRGPYALTRHPAAWGAWSISLGAAAVMLSPLAAAVAASLGSAAAVYVARQEARAWRARSGAGVPMTERLS